MATRRKVITVPRGTIEKICRSQNVGKTTVYAALNGTNHSETAQHIRHLAVNVYGGIESTKVYFT